MRIDVVTIFPELFELPLRTSIIGRAAEPAWSSSASTTCASTASAGIGRSTTTRTAGERGW